MSNVDGSLTLLKALGGALERKGSAAMAKRGLHDLLHTESADQLFQRAKEHRANGEFETSFECLKRVVALNKCMR